MNTTTKNPLRVVVTGGGTGGHLYPAMAVMDALREAGAQLLYIGSERGLENQHIPARGDAFERLDFFGMPRKLCPWAWTKWLWKLMTSVRKAQRLLETFQPDVVFGTGGYVAGPVLWAANRLRIPTVLHDPDAHPGLVSRLMAPHARAVTIAFEPARAMLKNANIHLTGNPVRPDIGQMSEAEGLAALGLDWPVEQKVLLVMGGSQGAQRINQAVAEALPTLIDMGWAVLHQTGPKHYDTAMAFVPEAFKQHPRSLIRPYFDDMASVLAVADVALCRAGSMSLAELYVAGLPSILVPYPHAAADHQRKNAEASVAAGASRLLPDADCTAQSVVALLQLLGADPDLLPRMARASRALAHPHATAEITTLLKQVGAG